MLKQTIYTIALLLTAAWLPAQDFNHYHPLKSQGEIPASILTRSSEKFEKERDVLAQEGSKLERASKEDFLLQSNFALDAILLSGRVLYNDPIGEYLNSIKDYLLKDQPEARDSIRIFVVRSPLVNAFCTNNGIVLVHMGLLAKVKNEAQLAYILCHEFQHFLRQHPITRFVEDKKRRSQLRIVDFEDFEDYILAKNRYSREQELEADAEGIELFLQSDYAASELDGTFDVMRYAYLPFEDREWSAEFFDSENFWLPPNLAPDTIQAISAEEDYDDSRLSHPNISTRRKAVQDRLEEEALTGKDYIISKERFQHAQTTCRFEMAHQFLNARSYERAIYQSFLLLQEHPRSYFLKRTIAQSLYGLVKFKNARSFYAVHEDYEDIEGNSQTLYFATERLEKEELNALAINYVWRLRQEDPEDPVLYALSQDLMDEFFGKHVEFVEQMNTEPSGKTKAEVYPPRQEEVVEEADSTVVDGKLLDKTITSLLSEDGEEAEETLGYLETNRESNDYFLLNAFVDLFPDPEFKREFDRRLSIRKESKGIWDKENEPERVRKSYYDEELGKVNNPVPTRLGTDTVLFISPLVKDIDERPKGKSSLIAEEKAAETYSDLIGEMADLVGMEYKIMSTMEIEGNDIGQFNDMVVLREWISEAMSNEFDKPMVNIHQQEAEAVMDKYGTDLLALNAAINYTSFKNPLKVSALSILLPFIPLTPLAAYQLFKRENSFMYVNWVWNVRTGEIMMRETRFLRQRGRTSTMKSALHYSFLQMTAAK